MIATDCPGCDGTVPVCPKCGIVWDNVSVWSDGSRSYSTTLVKVRYEALYGQAPAHMFQETASLET